MRVRLTCAPDEWPTEVSEVWGVDACDVSSARSVYIYIGVFIVNISRAQDSFSVSRIEAWVGQQIISLCGLCEWMRYEMPPSTPPHLSIHNVCIYPSAGWQRFRIIHSALHRVNSIYTRDILTQSNPISRQYVHIQYTLPHTPFFFFLLFCFFICIYYHLGAGIEIAYQLLFNDDALAPTPVCSVWTFIYFVVVEHLVRDTNDDDDDSWSACVVCFVCIVCTYRVPFLFGLRSTGRVFHVSAGTTAGSREKKRNSSKRSKWKTSLHTESALADVHSGIYLSCFLIRFSDNLEFPEFPRVDSLPLARTYCSVHTATPISLASSLSLSRLNRCAHRCIQYIHHNGILILF